MCRELERKGLKKVLGKVKSFKGTFDRSHDNTALVLNVTYKGKNNILADHIWLGLDAHYFKHGDIIEFKGCAESYVDSFGVRKYGIESIHNARLYAPDEDHRRKTAKKDNYFMRERKKRRYK